MENISVSGVLPVNKPSDMTSHDVVNIIRKLYGTKSVGHTGTLDPMATGLLNILIGRAVKASEYLVCDSKKYRAVLRLGITTDTEDITGRTLSTSDFIPDAREVEDICHRFTGKIMQTPPMYSALKVGGQKLCDLARRGESIERAAREIEIFSLSCKPTDTPADFTLEVHCSSGTYIRTLCADIGKELGCGGVMAALERTEAGGFSLKQAHSPDELREMSASELSSLLIPVEELFSSLSAVNLPVFYERLCRNGCEIYQKKIGTSFEPGTKVRLCNAAGKFFALGEVRNFSAGSALKTLKFFDLESTAL